MLLNVKVNTLFEYLDFFCFNYSLHDILVVANTELKASIFILRGVWSV